MLQSNMSLCLFLFIYTKTTKKSFDFFFETRAKNFFRTRVQINENFWKGGKFCKACRRYLFKKATK